MKTDQELGETREVRTRENKRMNNEPSI